MGRNFGLVFLYTFIPLEYFDSTVLMIDDDGSNEEM